MVELVRKKQRQAITHVCAPLDGRERTAQKVIIDHFLSLQSITYYDTILESLLSFDHFDFIDPDYCYPTSPCKNGTCHEEDPPKDYRCECNTGWKGKNCTEGENSLLSIV